MVDRSLARLGFTLSLLLLCMLAPLVARAELPPPTAVPNTGNFQARFQRDKTDISLMTLSGSYDENLPDGNPNYEPRTVIAKEFFRTHQDRYDFIVVFTNFEFNTGEAIAFHSSAQNKVKGLGMPLYDNSAMFGSKGKLQGFIDMAALSRYVTNPYDARFDKVLQTFAHEFMHQWGVNTRIRLPNGELSEELLGKDKSHWSFLLDSGASVEYGNQWRDNGNGTFTSVAGRQFFSALDLYLMGMYRKEEVPPFMLITNSEIDKTRYPQNDVTVSGSKRMIAIDDVIAAEGAREPDAATSQKEFRFAFVLLSRDGKEATDADVAAVNNVRKAVAARLAVLTGGRALVSSYLEPKGDTVVMPGTPATARESAANASEGLNWLRARQAPEGFWKDNPFTAMRDSAVVIETLSEPGAGAFEGRRRALDWIAAETPANTDYLARQLRTLTAVGVAPGDRAARLVAMQNADGGWGVAPRYQSNALDTALALQALLPFEGSTASGKLDGAAAFLVAHQNPDGGWGNNVGGASRTAVSSAVLLALKGRASAPALYTKAIAFLATRQQSDGGFGEAASTVHDTANVLAALLTQNALGQIRAEAAIAFITSSQQSDGSWDGSVYSTALAVRLMKSSGLFNWTAGELKANPVAPLDGQQVVLSFKVGNSGTASAPPGSARVYDGDPASGGQQIGADLNVPALLVGDSVELKVLWNTLDKVGVHTIVAKVDPDGLLTEATKADNRAQLNLSVRAAPAATELSINLSDVSATPLHPTRLPTVMSISATVANIGRTDAASVRIVLRDSGLPGAPIVGEKIINLLGRTQQVVNFAASVTRPGVTSYLIVIDPDNAVSEADKTNNSVTVLVETAAGLDVEADSTKTSIAHDPVFFGADANFKTTIRNAGTQDSPPFRVRYSVVGPDKSVEVASRTLQLAAGASAVQDVAWLPDMEGKLSFKVELDPDNLLAETDEGNNLAQLPFQVLKTTGINLTVNFKDFTVNPAEVLEGAAVTLTQVVRNSGTAAAANVEVAFYDGDPAAGKLIGALQSIASIAPGQSVPVTTTWTRYPDAHDHLVFFVADPAAKLSDISRDDNEAFIVVSANSLPDLAIAGGDLLVTPELPRPGDALTISATLANLGKQGATNVVVRAFEGASQLGADQLIPVFAGLSAQTLTFQAPGSTAAETRSITIVVDPENAVLEKTKANNTAKRDMLAQDGDFSVTNRYFSPNGDGVKDDTTLGFRLKTAADVTVNVLDKSAKVVRSFSGDALKNQLNGAVRWDGLGQRGSLVPDGEYQMRVLDLAGTQLGGAAVTLDTNRASI
ncbi:CARDB domain-containing protein [Massilia sp. TWP1-3-3]|uniref:CARDB domain-containing protein n=1 Tax=Massilia sp. TWP1-3-3 TaxID=2804573 RepID=UPI003CED0C17